MAFRPPRCPFSDCPSAARRSFRWRRKGHFRRRCDGRLIQRFSCLHCRRGFSTQTFRLDYRLHRPRLGLVLFKDFVSKVTHRQAARTLGCSRRTLAHRLRLFGDHCQAFHRRALERAASSSTSSRPTSTTGGSSP
jgi:transposase-like protein